MHGLFSRARSLWRGLWRRADVETEMDEELRLHLELRTEDLIRSGLSPAEAARRARIEFGGVDRYKEEGRESRGLRYFDEIWGDLRYTTRSLRKAPAFTLAAVLTLALGIGANSAVFSLVSASLLRPLPFEDAERLVVLHQTYSEPGTEPYPLRWAYPEFTAVRSVLATVSELAAYTPASVNLSGGDDAVRVSAEIVSVSYFSALGVRPALGRVFLPEDDSVSTAHQVAILSHALWQRNFGGSSDILDRTILLQGVPLRVVGVAPAGFGGLTGDAEIWLPHAMGPTVYYSGHFTRVQHFFSLVGRLRPGATIEKARSELAVAGRRAAAAARDAACAQDELCADGEFAGEWTADLVSLDAARRDPSTVRARLVLASAVFVVLLIAVVNLSSLLLARSTVRVRETATRAALGAGRLRLIRQGLVEGALLGVLGGLVGAGLAFLSVRTLASLTPDHSAGPRAARVADVASFAEPSMDWRVVAFAVGVSVSIGMLASLLPARRLESGDLTRRLKTGARGASVGVGSLRRPTVLSVASTLQVACALVLLAAAGMLLQGFERLRSIDPGFDATDVLTLQVTPPDRIYGGAATAQLLERVLERVQALPGVVAATVGCPPYETCSWTSLYIEGRPAPAGPPPIVGRYYVGADHFRTLGIPLLRGRGLTAEDRAGRPGVAVINETAAGRFWPGEDAIGKRVWFGIADPSPGSATEIVGVVGDVLYGAPGSEIRPDFYTSYLQVTPTVRTTISIRADANPMSLVPALRNAVAAVDPNLAIHDVRLLEEQGAEALASERFATVVLAVFAGLGLLLASVGVYGIMAYSVAQRRREVGIRLALGAAPREVRRFVLAQGLALTMVGILVGSLASLGLTRALPALMVDVTSLDMTVFMRVVAILVLVAVLACYLPARSAMRVNPVETLASD